MLWLGIDFETTGLDTQNDRITEIGAVLWDPFEKKPLKLFHEFLKVDRPLTPEIQKLTGLSDAILEKYGKPFKSVAENMAELFQHCSHVVAHNGTGFDKPLFKAECVRHKVGEWERPWIDTSVDVPFPADITARKLTYLAAEHGFLNPFAHRAVFDVLTMLTVISNYDPHEIVRWSESPAVTIRAKVDYADRAKASSRGYRWDAARKFWVKTIKEFQLEKERQEAMFTVEVLPTERTA